MGAFIGYGDTGVSANNRERDAFLDWYGEYRCKPHDQRWDYCKSEAHRWSGCSLQLGELIPQGEEFVLSETEYGEAAREFWPHVAQLLNIISMITRGEWPHLIGSEASRKWRDVVRPMEFTASECAFNGGLGGASCGAETRGYHYVLFGSQTDDQHPEFTGVYFEFDSPRDGDVDIVNRVLVGDSEVRFELHDRRKIIVRRGTDQRQWGEFARGLQEVFGERIVRWT
jgi:hypothetical protein